MSAEYSSVSCPPHTFMAAGGSGYLWLWWHRCDYQEMTEYGAKVTCLASPAYMGGGVGGGGEREGGGSSKAKSNTLHPCHWLLWGLVAKGEQGGGREKTTYAGTCGRVNTTTTPPFTSCECLQRGDKMHGVMPTTKHYGQNAGDSVIHAPPPSSSRREIQHLFCARGS
jgi:hypothetical protein